MFQLRLLVADGDRDMTDRLRVWLASWGYDAHTANTGPDAMRVAEYHQPHIAILNLALPELDGLGVARLLSRQTTRIAITELTQEAGRPRGWEAEFHSLFAKPIDWTRLRQLLMVLEREHEHLESLRTEAAAGPTAPRNTLLAMEGAFVIRTASRDRAPSELKA
jgi:DNA-binding response OmpR family regulator